MRQFIWWGVVIWLSAALAGCTPPLCTPQPVRNHAPVCYWWECPRPVQGRF